MPAIQQDAANTNDRVTFETEDDAANAFLNLFADKADDDASKKKPSDKGAESNAEDKDDDAKASDADDEQPTDEDAEGDEPSDESPDEDAEGDDEEDAEDDETKDKDKKFAESDDVYTKVKVGDEEHEVSIKDLKRLYGQEAALTRKSQEVAAKTKEVEASQAKNLAALDVLVKRAQEASKPYHEINWAGLMKDPNVTADEVSALQQAARVAIENETFLTQQLDAFMGEIQTQQQAVHAKAAQECLKALTTEDSPAYIKGWNKDLYNDIRSFAVEMGMHKEAINSLTEAPAFKLLHMAMQFHRGAKKVVTTKVNKAPKKIVKSSTAQSNVSRSTTSKDIARKQSVAKLAKSGSMEDAAAAFETMFTGGD